MSRQDVAHHYEEGSIAEAALQEAERFGYGRGWNDAIEAAAERIEHYRDVVMRSAGKGTESGAYNIAVSVIRDLKKP